MHFGYELVHYGALRLHIRHGALAFSGVKHAMLRLSRALVCSHMDAAE